MQREADISNIIYPDVGCQHQIIQRFEPKKIFIRLSIQRNVPQHSFVRALCQLIQCRVEFYGMNHVNKGDKFTFFVLPTGRVMAYEVKVLCGIYTVEYRRNVKNGKVIGCNLFGGWRDTICSCWEKRTVGVLLWKRYRHSSNVDLMIKSNTWAQLKHSSARGYSTWVGTWIGFTPNETLDMKLTKVNESGRVHFCSLLNFSLITIGLFPQFFLC